MDIIYLWGVWSGIEHRSNLGGFFGSEDFLVDGCRLPVVNSSHSLLFHVIPRGYVETLRIRRVLALE